MPKISKFNTTRLTSLFDLKWGSYFHNHSVISFLQYGLEDGYTRYIPYEYKKLSNPKECLIEDRTYPVCEKGCMKRANNPKYPPYVPRCRSWYQAVLRRSSQYDSAYE